MNEKLLNNLSNAILQSGYSISDISRKSQISRPTLYNILNKSINTVSLDTVNGICHAIGVSPSYIMSQEQRKGVRIPVLGSIPAGIPIEAVEEVIDYEEISPEMAATGEYFGLKVRGDSMLPTIKNGDVVIIKKQSDTTSNKICVVMINGYDATLKEVKKDPNGVWILPHNPDSEFKPTFYTNEEIEKLPIRIIGVAVEIRRSL